MDKTNKGDNVIENFEAIYNKIRESIKDKSITVYDLIPIATNVMQIVQKYPNLSGNEKKKLVVNVIKQLVDDSDIIPQEQEAIALTIIQYTLPHVIDAVVAAYKKNIDLKKIKEDCIGGKYKCTGSKKCCKK